MIYSNYIHVNDLLGTCIETCTSVNYARRDNLFSRMYLAKVTKYSLVARKTLSPRRTTPTSQFEELVLRACFRCNTVIARINYNCLSAYKERNINGEAVAVIYSRIFTLNTTELVISTLSEELWKITLQLKMIGLRACIGICVHWISLIVAALR